MAVSSSQRPHVHDNCPECEEEEPVAPILLMGLGGMALFFAFGLGLASAVADGLFLWPTIILAVVGGAMVIVGYRMSKRHKIERKERQQAAMANAKCSYCGGQNQPSSKKCEFCGAPLF